MAFPVVCASWVLKNWCFWIVLLEKTLESPWDRKEIKPVNPIGNQSWIFTRRTDAQAEATSAFATGAKNQLIRKDLDTGKDGGLEEKGVTQDEVVEWHHWHKGHEFDPMENFWLAFCAYPLSRPQPPRDGQGQGELARQLTAVTALIPAWLTWDSEKEASQVPRSKTFQKVTSSHKTARKT